MILDVIFDTWGSRVGRVDDHRQTEVAGYGELFSEQPHLVLIAVVQSDLADAYDPAFFQIAGRALRHSA